MSNFSTIYKKTFKQILFPHGYKLWKSVFYKEIDDYMCFFIKAKKIVHSNVFEVYVMAVPYCADITEMEFDPREEMYNITEILAVLMPDTFSPKNISHEKINKYNQYCNLHFTAYDEESAQNSLNAICADLEKLVLPHIHKFTNLQIFYDEHIKTLKTNASKNYNHYRDEFVHGLSLKLRKYENAVHYLDFEMSRHNNILESAKLKLPEMKKGNIKAVFQGGCSDELVSLILKRQPDYLDRQIASSEETITSSTNEIKRLQTIKDALLSNNQEFLDNLVKETEKNSREYVRNMVIS